MHCPYCNNSESKVIDSRDATDGVRRRRECIRCGLRFTTYERVQTSALMVAKRDNRREEYNREKLMSSIQKACVKRPLPTGAIDKLVHDIEIQLQDTGRAEIPSVSIGEMVIEHLRTMDPVAYIRFASVYRDFADVESFKEAVEALEKAYHSTDKERDSAQLPLIDETIFSTKKRLRKPRAGLDLNISIGDEKR
ncbi:MAG: transcriptional repressor NrdR [SAR202 cluster bacterium]|nr:transcriptional repressor NrdR [SAR202 cluster bacterium]